MKHTILITGGAGFIGSSLIESLLPNYKIICLDNFNDYYNPNWKRENINSFLHNPNFQLFNLDILDFKALEQIFINNKIGKVIHLAARAGVRPSIQNPLLYEEVNIKGTLNMLEMAKKHKVLHFIFASSSSIYGNQTKIPFSETDSVNEPISPYAASKKSAEMFCYTYAHLFDIKITCLRFFTVYGPKGRPDMAPFLFTQSLFNNLPINQFGDGTSKRDFTFIDDIVDGILKAIQNPFKFEIINLGNNMPISLNDFIKTLEDITGIKANINKLNPQAGDVKITIADITKAKKLLNWTPSTNLRTGLEIFVNWYRENRLASKT